MYYKGSHKMYARHCAIDLIKIHKSYSKAISLAQEGLRWAKDYNEECYWNRVIRELDLYETYVNFKQFGIYYVYTKGGGDQQRS